ncbi:hypothetical protein D3C85_1615890 [compost metagenome]
MQQVQIDVFGLQAPQAARAGLGNALATGVVRVDLADQKDFVAQTSDGFCDHFLGATFSVHFRGVDQRHAQLYAQSEGRDFTRVRRGILAHTPSALADDRYIDAGQFKRAHENLLSVTR